MVHLYCCAELELAQLLVISLAVRALFDSAHPFNFARRNKLELAYVSS